jgi:hypothetical protein
MARISKTDIDPAAAKIVHRLKALDLVAGQSRPKKAPQREGAERAIRKLCGGIIPGKAVVSNADLVKKVRAYAVREGLRHFSRDTILRAAASTK